MEWMRPSNLSRVGCVNSRGLVGGLAEDESCPDRAILLKLGWYRVEIPRP